jgi:hypothetical protein
VGQVPSFKQANNSIILANNQRRHNPLRHFDFPLTDSPDLILLPSSSRVYKIPPQPTPLRTTLGQSYQKPCYFYVFFCFCLCNISVLNVCVLTTQTCQCLLPLSGCISPSNLFFLHWRQTRFGRGISLQRRLFFFVFGPYGFANEPRNTPQSLQRAQEHQETRTGLR